MEIVSHEGLKPGASPIGEKQDPSY